MASGWKNIAVFFDDTPESERVGDLAAGIAQRCGAHLIGVHSITGSPGELPGDAFIRGRQGFDDFHARQLAAEKEKAAAVEARFAAIAGRWEISSEFRVIWSGRAAEDVVQTLLHCDVAVLGYPQSPGLAEDWSVDRLLMATGVPILVIPNGWSAGAIGTRIYVAWNASREARRAIGDAMPLLGAAGSVTVLIVDPRESSARYGEEPGADISLYLARHDVHVELRQVASDGLSIAGTILATAASAGADLVVMGAYSHARSAEIVFGGITRAMLAQMSIPILMSR